MGGSGGRGGGLPRVVVCAGARRAAPQRPLPFSYAPDRVSAAAQSINAAAGNRLPESADLARAQPRAVAPRTGPAVCSPRTRQTTQEAKAGTKNRKIRPLPVTRHAPMVMSPLEESTAGPYCARGGLLSEPVRGEDPTGPKGDPPGIRLARRNPRTQKVR